jgi:hypothetical protein
MQSVVRKPLQGIGNIIRFNWHYYAFAIVFSACLYIGQNWMTGVFQHFLLILSIAIIASIFISLIVSFYIYDLSGLYKLAWLDPMIHSNAKVVNIHAGFDETSALLAQKFTGAMLMVLDFYDPKKHTEVSIKRARKAYDAYPGTKSICTSTITIPASETDLILCILSAHEIRNRNERIIFFQQLTKALKAEGKVVVVEHLRDLANLLSYNIGSFHFHSEKEWKLTFQSAGLQIKEQARINPFITVFTLQKNGITS